MFSDATPVGLQALISKLGLRVIPPAVTSVAGPGERRTIIANGRVTEKYRKIQAPEDTLLGHLKFALRYEPSDLGALKAVFAAADVRELEAWVRSEPSSIYARRSWFLYEWLTGRTLDVPDMPSGAGGVSYTPALDPALHLTSGGVQSRRHKVLDNLLGVPGFCPVVRRTQKLDDYMAAALDTEARSIVDSADPELLQRATNYLYTKETKSTFELEHEVASPQRAERFVAALRQSAKLDPSDLGALLELQNSIVDQRYAATGLRDFQNFVGDNAGGYRQVVHFICPRPQDVPSLMNDWAGMTARLSSSDADPVAAATLSAFGFVFIHPYEDGNGRIHRFMMHHMLAARGFTPPDILFPVSASILRDRKGYDAALESFSIPSKACIDWKWNERKEIDVLNETADLYRYFDATPLTEFLYEKVAETIRKDLKEELDFVAVYDRAMTAVRERIDMPDRRASLLVKLLLQNNGTLSKKKRPEFDEITDDEIALIEADVQEAIATDEPAATFRP